MAPAEIEVYSSFWSLLKPVLVHHVYWEQTIASISFDENPLSRKKHYHEYTNKRKLSIGTSQRIPQNLTFIFSPCLSFSRGHCVRNHTPGEWERTNSWWVEKETQRTANISAVGLEQIQVTSRSEVSASFPRASARDTCILGSRQHIWRGKSHI